VTQKKHSESVKSDEGEDGAFHMQKKMRHTRGVPTRKAGKPIS
jgi:hypothetical protein